MDRKAVRLGLKALFDETLVGEGKPLQAVFAYRVSDFNAKSPVLVIGSVGSKRKRLANIRQHATFSITLYLFVLYADEQWSDEQAAADSLDEIEAQIYDVLDLNQRTENWQVIQWDGSQVDVMAIGGKGYLREAIPLQVEVF